jgi:P-type E1-E2 ATPase
MIAIDIPGRQIYNFEYLVLDMNGTIALDSVLLAGVRERLDILRPQLDIAIITADTHGKAGEVAAALNVKMHKIARENEQLQKQEFVQSLGADSVVSIGNGANDALMLQASGIGICVIGAEGTSSEAVSNSDVIVTDINAALDLLIKPARLIATLRR